MEFLPDPNSLEANVPLVIQGTVAIAFGNGNNGRKTRALGASFHRHDDDAKDTAPFSARIYLQQDNMGMGMVTTDANASRSDAPAGTVLWLVLLNVVAAGTLYLAQEE